MFRFRPIKHQVQSFALTRLGDGGPAGDVDVSSEDRFVLLEARKDVTPCPDC